MFERMDEGRGGKRESSISSSPEVSSAGKTEQKKRWKTRGSGRRLRRKESSLSPRTQEKSEKQRRERDAKL